MKKLLTILLLTMPFNALANCDTDLNCCIWSYEGILTYDEAESGCLNGNLDGLGNIQLANIANFSEQQFREVQAVIRCQADTGNAERCADIVNHLTK